MTKANSFEIRKFGTNRGQIQQEHPGIEIPKLRSDRGQ